MTHAQRGYWFTPPRIADEAAELGDPEWSSSFRAQSEGDSIHVHLVPEHEEWVRAELSACKGWVDGSCLDGRVLESLSAPPHREVDRELLVRLLAALGFSDSCGRADVPGPRCWQAGTLVRMARDAERFFVEAILREAPDHEIEVVRRMGFTFDESGIEGLEWMSVTPLVSPLAMVITWLALAAASRVRRCPPRRLASAGLLTLSVATCGVVRDRQHDGDVRETFEFLSQVIATLDGYHADHGVYPDSIRPEWYAGPLPELLRPDFYVVYDGGTRYLLRFRDPRSDPRFWWIDVYGYQSERREWQQYDGY